MPKRIPDEQLLHAAVRVVVQRGFQGATTKQIAAEAGVNEVTLFRRFGSKAELLREAVRREAEAFTTNRVTPTGDLRADLESVVAGYQDLMSRLGPLVPVVLSEAARGPELKEVIAEPAKMLMSVAVLLGHYQRLGALKPEPPLAAVSSLLGPILVTAMASHASGMPALGTLDPAEYIDRYLEGRQGGSVAD